MNEEHLAAQAPPKPPETLAFVVRVWLWALWFRASHGFRLHHVYSFHHRTTGRHWPRWAEVSLLCTDCDKHIWLRDD